MSDVPRIDSAVAVPGPGAQPDSYLCRAVGARFTRLVERLTRRGEPAIFNAGPAAYDLLRMSLGFARGPMFAKWGTSGSYVVYETPFATMVARVGMGVGSVSGREWDAAWAIAYRDPDRAMTSASEAPVVLANLLDGMFGRGVQEEILRDVTMVGDLTAVELEGALSPRNVRAPILRAGAEWNRLLHDGDIVKADGWMGLVSGAPDFAFKHVAIPEDEYQRRRLASAVRSKSLAEAARKVEAEEAAKRPPQQDAGPNKMGRVEADRERYAAEVSAHHAPNPEAVARIKRIRAATREFLVVLLANAGPGSDRSAAVRCAREAMMWANASVVVPYTPIPE